MLDGFIGGISRNIGKASTNNHLLAIPPHCRQGLDSDSFDSNDSISLSSNFFHPSHFGFCHSCLVLDLQADFHTCILASDNFNPSDIKMPTFYSISKDGNEIAYIFFMSIVGVVFGGIHYTGWFSNFPSSDEAMLWWVSSAVLTGITFLLPLPLFHHGNFIGHVFFC